MDGTGTDAGQSAREQEYVITALNEAMMLVAGLDAVVATMNVQPITYSALRTKLAHAITRAEAVLAHLRGQPAPRPRSGP